MKQRLLNILISLDQTIFSLVTLGASNPDETMSAAAWRLEQSGRVQGRIFRPIIDKLFFFDKNHCEISYRNEVAKAKQLCESLKDA